MVAAVEHLAARIQAVDVEAGSRRRAERGPDPDGAGDHEPALRRPLPDAYVELWVACHARIPSSPTRCGRSDEAARDAVRALFGDELLEHAGPEFDGLLDLTMYTIRGMALDAHLATADDRQARVELILGLRPALEQALETER